ncbi:FixH family protein [Amaricoccus tamworthensis]|uniref:FixH family protein n=1 Tax=Amaricoccus tamworthensis TaxID=57002 RepID=UPI003C7CCC27
MNIRGRPLTGRDVALIFALFFGVILAANLTLLFNAVSTFSGLVVPNSYVASQSFDRNREAQEALGWSLNLDYADGSVALAMRDSEGRLVRPASLDLTIGRPTTERDDIQPQLIAGPDGYTATATLAPGIWRAEIEATDFEGETFRQRLNLYVPALK